MGEGLGVPLSVWVRMENWTPIEASALLSGCSPPTEALSNYDLDAEQVPTWLPAEYREAYLDCFGWFVKTWSVGCRDYPFETHFLVWEILSSAQRFGHYTPDLPGLSAVIEAYEASERWPTLANRLNLDKWRSRSIWTIEQAAYILMGVEPKEQVSFEERSPKGRPAALNRVAQHIDELKRQIDSAVLSRELIALHAKPYDNVRILGGSFEAYYKALGQEWRYAFRREDILEWAQMRQRRGDWPEADKQVLDLKPATSIDTLKQVRALSTGKREALQIQMLWEFWRSHGHEAGKNVSASIRTLEALQKVAPILTSVSDTKVRKAIKVVDNRDPDKLPGPNP